jgi:hypothetical protein
MKSAQTCNELFAWFDGYEMFGTTAESNDVPELLFPGALVAAERGLDREHADGPELCRDFRPYRRRRLNDRIRLMGFENLNGGCQVAISTKGRSADPPP